METIVNYISLITICSFRNGEVIDKETGKNSSVSQEVYLGYGVSQLYFWVPGRVTVGEGMKTFQRTINWGYETFSRDFYCCGVASCSHFSVEYENFQQK